MRQFRVGLRPAAMAAILAALAVAVWSAAAPAATRSVTVGDNFFKPKSLSVKRGTTVKWTWVGTSNPHNVKVRKGPVKFGSKTKTSGSFSRKMTVKGKYSLYCTVHATTMKMTLTVG